MILNVHTAPPTRNLMSSPSNWPQQICQYAPTVPSAWLTPLEQYTRALGGVECIVRSWGLQLCIVVQSLQKLSSPISWICTIFGTGISETTVNRGKLRNLQSVQTTSRLYVQVTAWRRWQVVTHSETDQTTACDWMRLFEFFLKHMTAEYYATHCIAICYRWFIKRSL